MRYIFHVLLLLLVVDVYAQQNVEFDEASFSSNAKGLGEAKKSISRGNIHLVNSDYIQALSNYEKAKQFNPNNALLNFKIGLCYFHTDKDSLARLAFEKALVLEKNVAPDIHYYVASAYQLNGLFEEAQKHFEIEKISAIANADTSYILELEKRIIECVSGKKMRSDTLLQAYSMGDSINSPYNENSIFVAHDSLIYITSQRPTKQGQTSEDIYSAEKKKGKWSSLQNLEKPINTYGNDAVIGLSNNGQKMFIYADVNGGDIYYSEKKHGLWTKPLLFGDSINTQRFESSLCFSRDYSKVYFISDREGAVGAKDIFVSTKKEIGWSTPVNLGAVVNSAYDETSPYFYGDTLFFSSRGHNSCGGYDVFKTYQQNGEWTNPINLGFPVNSPYDDLYYTVSKTHEYLISDRPKKTAGSNVLEIDLVRKKTPELLAEDSSTDEEDSLKLLAESEQKINEKLSQLKPNESIDIAELMELKPVLFGFNESHINEESALMLDKIKELLTKHPEIKLEVSVHTDCRGSSTYNKALSQKRASSIVNYISSEKMIDANRIHGGGFGEEKPVAKCNCGSVALDNLPPCTEEDHQKNRRAEFKIGVMG